MPVMEKLIEFGMWPLSVVIIVLVGLGMFRSQLAGLINRAKKIGSGTTAIDFSEAAITERQQMQVQTTTKSLPTNQIENHPLGPPSVVVADVEREVTEKLTSFNEGDETKMKRLVRGFSVMMLQKEFEILYRTIFGSQLDLLLRANAGGIGDLAAQEIFENAKGLYPNVHQTATFDMWLAFPLNTRLIERRQGLIVTTPRGKEFLQYLVEVGLTNPRNNG